MEAGIHRSTQSAARPSNLTRITPHDKTPEHCSQALEQAGLALDALPADAVPLEGPTEHDVPGPLQLRGRRRHLADTHATCAHHSPCASSLALSGIPLASYVPEWCAGHGFEPLDADAATRPPCAGDRAAAATAAADAQEDGESAGDDVSGSVLDVSELISAVAPAPLEIRRPSSSIAAHSRCRRALLFSCGEAATGGAPDRDAPAADRVAILPDIRRTTINARLRAQAHDHIARTRAAHVRKPRQPQLAPFRTFGLTDDERYRTLLHERKVQRLVKMDTSTLERRMKALSALDRASSLEQRVKEQQRIINGPRGLALFRQAGRFFRTANTFAENGEPALPMDLDANAPPLDHKMRHPTLSDIHYLLGHWGTKWEGQRQCAWQARAGNIAATPAAVAARSSQAAANLYGYPIDQRLEAPGAARTAGSSVKLFGRNRAR